MMRLMKYALVLLIVSVLTTSLTAQNQEGQPAPQRPFLGARISAEIPDLVRKHLRLQPDQGLLVENIYRDGPADKAGLDKDDILLSIDEKPLTNPHELFRTMWEIGVGGSATVEFIHMGQLCKTTITFEAMGPQFRFDHTGWKYPIEPDESMIFRPGRMFRRRPGDREWIEIPFDQLKEQFESRDSQLPKLGTQYHFLHDDGRTAFTIVIEGNPNEPTATVIVKTPEKEYFTTISQIDRLPQEYQQTVKNDIEKAKKTFERGRNLKLPPEFDFSKFPPFPPDIRHSQRTEARGEEARSEESRGGENDASRSETADKDDSGTPQEHLERQLEILSRQIEQMRERQKALEALLKEKTQQTN